MDSAPSPLSFIFKDDEKTDFGALRQGDLILRTKRLREALEEGHNHYASHSDYTHFMVLTQSCDLAVREGSAFRAPYITVCATKPLQSFLDRKLLSAFASAPGPLRVGRSAMLRGAESIVNRLISNTSDEVFFLDAFTAKSVSEPICAFLQLSIALHSQHFEALLAAKQAEMEDVFAAKLGWMTGNLYSRVATPDLHETNPESARSFQEKMMNVILHRDTVWLDKRQIKDYQTALARATAAKGSDLTLDEAKTIADSCPKPIQELSLAVISGSWY